jgi:hypothetical protein
MTDLTVSSLVDEDRNSELRDQLIAVPVSDQAEVNRKGLLINVQTNARGVGSYRVRSENAHDFDTKVVSRGQPPADFLTAWGLRLGLSFA